MAKTGASVSLRSRLFKKGNSGKLLEKYGKIRFIIVLKCRVVSRSPHVGDVLALLACWACNSLYLQRRTRQLTRGWFKGLPHSPWFPLDIEVCLIANETKWRGNLGEIQEFWPCCFFCQWQRKAVKPQLPESQDSTRNLSVHLLERGNYGGVWKTGQGVGFWPPLSVALDPAGNQVQYPTSSHRSIIMIPMESVKMLAGTLW